MNASSHFPRVKAETLPILDILQDIKLSAKEILDWLSID
jgi:hypothetical protein